jgi:hypothetical protein
MKAEECFPDNDLAQLRAACSQEPRVAAIYAFDLRRAGECQMVALFTETPPWPDRLDLEVAVGKALGMEGIELVDLHRMPLVTRFDVVNRGEPLFVGQPEALAIFIEETIVRYSAFYPLLEALYWQVETGPLSEDMLDE